MMTKFVRVNDNISTTTAPNMDTSNSMISTTEKYDYDLALTAISGLPTMLPISQDVEATATIKNQGLESCSGSIAVTVSGTEVVTIDVPTIAPDATADIPVTFGLGTTQTGNVDIKMEVTITGQTDGNTADNTATASIEVTETVLAYDHTTPDMYNGNHVIGVDENYNFVAAIPIHITNDDVCSLASR